MSVDEVADLRQRNRALADEVEGLRAALAARAETDAAVTPAGETAFGRAFWRAPARIDATLPDPDPARLDDAEFRNLADHLPILCWLARSDGYLFWYNRRWLDYCGTTQEAMAGWGWQAVHDPAELPRVKAVWAAAIATGEPFEMVFPLRGADGVFRPFLTRIVPLRDATGRVARWFGVNTEIGAQARAEAALRASEGRLRRAQEAGGVGVFTIDIASDTVHGTPNFFRLYGLPEQDRLPVDVIASLVSPDDAGLIARRADRAAGRAARDVAYRIRRADTGAERWIAWRGAFERDGAGRAVRFVGAVRDITDHKAAEGLAEANERELRLITDALPVLIAFIGRDYIYRFANAAYQDWFFRPASEIVGRDVRALLTPANAELRRTYIERALAGEAVLFEAAWPHADGRHRDAEIRYLPRRDAGGAVDGFHVFVQDITDRKEVEATLLSEVTQRTRERDRLWETTNDLMGTAGLDGFLKSVNPAWARMLGWTEAELLGRPFATFIDPDDHAEAAAVVGRLAAGERVAGFVDRVLTRAGDRRVVMWTAVPEPGAGLFYIVGRDLTEQRRAEEQLLQAQKMEAIGQLTGGIAHDFNNLLTGIIGSLELMQTRIRQGRFDAIERYAGAAMASANRAAALTHRLLAFARRQPLAPQPTAANPLIAGMEELLRRTLGERVELALVTAADLWLTLCDPHQLENAVLNLAINARDAMPEGGRLVIETGNARLGDADARLEAGARAGSYVSIRVSDTGTGMSPEVAARAFDPFFTTKPLGQGTGLGLSMIYGFARQSEGHVRIESEPGRGTAVTLYLPRHRGVAEPESVASDRTVLHRAARGETVLVVEDEPVVRDLIVEVLADLGYTAVRAADARAGLALLRGPGRIDLLISDVGLPGGLDGRQMVDAARPHRPDLKVLFITGYAENATFGTGHLEPGMQMITKPFSVEVLAARVRAMIAGRD
ncbi:MULTISPECIES: PAS domain-containing protein [unclassified Methylobacterium]|uniref:hybrid sensor histidine kinase/response regulator n=1 Tax=unclassified Methylobacterium TaxID=2615210 RepID=UPI00068BEE85|nr:MULTISPECIES: PAS domain-containing protein [unclassified Methylobacterium]SFU74426.1 PAS domain S-box-containing protein [Methylobacterium sp. UNCCL125]